MFLEEIHRKPKKQKTCHDAITTALGQEPPVDRLSSLPDALLVDILCLLPTKTTVTTSVLSRRYRHLWSEVTSRHLYCRHFPLLSADIYSVADRLLSQLTSPVIRSFIIRAPYPQPHYLESWLRLLCSRHVQKIEFTNVERCRSGSSSPLILPRCILRTPSLVSLNLSAYVCTELPNDDNVIVNLPNLNKLRLNVSASASQLGFVSKLIKSCPSLEELILSVEKYSTKDGVTHDNDGGLVRIYSGNLKILALLVLRGVKINNKVVIDAPKLDRFELVATLPQLTCSFVKNPSALHEATILCRSWTLTRSLFPAVLNVKVLHIHAPAIEWFERLLDDQGKPLIFQRLSVLRIHLARGSASIDELNSFRFELASPRLIRFVKKLRIMCSLKYRENLIKLVEYLIRNGPVLKRLTVEVYETDPNSKQPERESGDKLEEMMFCKDLYQCSMKFSSCVVAFCGWYVKLPTNSDELQVLEDQIGSSNLI